MIYVIISDVDFLTNNNPQISIINTSTYFEALTIVWNYLKVAKELNNIVEPGLNGFNIILTRNRPIHHNKWIGIVDLSDILNPLQKGV